MKKILMALFAFVVAASVATAGIGIAWTTQNWGEYHVGGGSILAGNDVLWQLIYAGADNTANPIHNDGVVAPMDAAAWAASWAGRRRCCPTGRPGGGRDGKRHQACHKIGGNHQNVR